MARWAVTPPPLESKTAPTEMTVSPDGTSTPVEATRKVLPRDLVPGDVVSPAWSEARVSGFDCTLVERVTDVTDGRTDVTESVTLFRPYATTPDFVYGRDPSVIPFIGVERYEVRRSSTEHVFTRWHRTVT